MYNYPKKYLNIAEQIKSLKDAGMTMSSESKVEVILQTVGFYRLRGYSYHLYDKSNKKYMTGTSFEDIFKIYQFDQELSNLIFSMISKIEVALRVRLIQTLRIHNNPLILNDPSIFED